MPLQLLITQIAALQGFVHEQYLQPFVHVQSPQPFVHVQSLSDVVIISLSGHNILKILRFWKKTRDLIDFLLNVIVCLDPFLQNLYHNISILKSNMEGEL